MKNNIPVLLKSGFILVLGLPCSLLGQTESIENGDLFIRDATGRVLRMTSHGRALEGTVSPDGSLAAILETSSFGGKQVAVKNVQNPEKEPSLVIQEPVLVGNMRLRIAGHCDWSSDGKKIYFLLEFESTSDLLAVADLQSGKVEKVDRAISFGVVRTGRYFGKIVALKRKSTIVRPWDWFWLMEADGVEIGPIGGDEDLREFVDRFCEDARPCVPALRAYGVR